MLVLKTKKKNIAMIKTSHLVKYVVFLLVFFKGGGHFKNL